MKLEKIFVLGVFLLFNTISFNQVVADTLVVEYNNDTYVRSNMATTNFNTDVNMFFYYASTQTYRTFIKFDLSSIPTNAIVTSAKLVLNPAWINNAASHPAYLERVSASWDGTLINWNNQPLAYASDQIAITHPQTSSMVPHEFTVTSHVQNFINYPANNNGWRLRLQSESGTARGVQYRTSASSVPSLHPSLIINYVLPVEVAGFVSHCSEGVDDGAIDASVTEGSGTYSTYEWFRYNMGTVSSIQSGSSMATLDIDSLQDGLYLLTVVDNLGYRGYKYFLIGEENTTTTVEFSNTNNTNSALFNDDAVFQYIISTSDGSVPGGSSTYIQTQTNVDGYVSSLLKFRVNFDPLLTYELANLHLYGVTGGHLRVSGYTNESKISRATQAWEENIVTWNTKPAIVTTDQITIPATAVGTSTRDDVFSILNFVNFWKDNPNENFGVRFDIPAQSTLNRLLYQSYDFTTHAKRPKLVLTYSIQTMYHELSESPQGGYYAVPGDDILRIKYNEEYLDENLSLSYFVKNNTGATVLSHATQPKTIEYGDNREKINVAALPAGYYTLEVFNDKNEKWYLRFKVI